MTFNWPVLVKAAWQHLGMRPEKFWELTPAEFALLMDTPAQAAPLRKAGLEALMKAWPDEPFGEQGEQHG